MRILELRSSRGTARRLVGDGAVDASRAISSLGLLFVGVGTGGEGASIRSASIELTEEEGAGTGGAGGSPRTPEREEEAVATLADALVEGRVPEISTRRTLGRPGLPCPTVGGGSGANKVRGGEGEESRVKLVGTGRVIGTVGEAGGEDGGDGARWLCSRGNTRCMRCVSLWRMPKYSCTERRQTKKFRFPSHHTQIPGRNDKQSKELPHMKPPDSGRVPSISLEAVQCPVVTVGLLPSECRIHGIHLLPQATVNHNRTPRETQLRVKKYNISLLHTCQLSMPCTPK